MAKKAYLVLQNRQVFEGRRFGAETSSTGELVFTTGMTGYVETLTDPSYCGQIVLQTFPLIGNVGMISADMESAGSHAAGYVVREYCDAPSNFRCEGGLDEFLREAGVPGLYGVDTRAITKIIREAGVMNAAILGEPPGEDALEEIAAFAIRGAVAAVSGGERETFPAEGAQRFRVALLDCGAKRSIARSLVERGCEVIKLPYDTRAEEILELAPQGLLISNGPGDPAENAGMVEEIGKLIGRLPIFGICLGHQLLALAAGGETEKLKYGHRGANQPVKDLATGRVYITSQNHGYAVAAGSLADTGGKLRMVNANDGTCEGVDYPDMGAFSVQFHPEACTGPLDTQMLFDRFMELMGGKADAAE